MEEEEIGDDWNSEQIEQTEQTEQIEQTELADEEEKSQTMQESEVIPENPNVQQKQIIQDETSHSMDKQEDSIPPDQAQPIQVLSSSY